jgi:SH3-like domain-containing protein
MTSDIFQPSGGWDGAHRVRVQLEQSSWVISAGDGLMALRGFGSVAVLALAMLGVSAGTELSAKDSVITASGLPVPRYVSLKSDHVNVRAGPTKDNDVAWVYTRSGLPVEITAEFENWRRVRDSEGAEGWVYHSLLSGRRTAVITMKSKDDLASLYERADQTSAVTARLQAGVVAQVKRCAASWCRIVGNGFDGFIEQQRLWGVYADEKVE